MSNWPSGRPLPDARIRLLSQVTLFFWKHLARPSLFFESERVNHRGDGGDFELIQRDWSIVSDQKEDTDGAHTDHVCREYSGGHFGHAHGPCTEECY